MENDAGGGGGSRYLPYFSDIDVVPGDLAHFADLVEGDLGALRDAWNNAKRDMEGQPSPNFPGEYAQTFHYASGYPELAYDGDAGIQDGREFYRAYFLTLGAELALMEDVMRGLETLSQAARMIHNDYLASDASNASSMEGAFAVYEESSVLHALGEAENPDGGTGHE
jgi:hypothetical protein